MNDKKSYFHKNTNGRYFAETMKEGSLQSKYNGSWNCVIIISDLQDENKNLELNINYYGTKRDYSKYGFIITRDKKKGKTFLSPLVIRKGEMYCLTGENYKNYIIHPFASGKLFKHNYYNLPSPEVFKNFKNVLADSVSQWGYTLDEIDSF